jgi:voltage-gated potassium channel
MSPFRRLRVSLALLVAVAAVGTFGFVSIEHFPLIDAVYMTVTTLTTVGFGEIHPLSPAGRLFTIGLICVGLATVYGVIGSALELLFEEHLRGAVEHRRVEHRLRQLKDHVIICGYGRIGQELARELAAQDHLFVVVDRDPQHAAALTEASILHVIGDASEEETLRHAGIERARSLIAVASTDAENIFITLTSRSLNPRLQIVARSVREQDQHKLRRAGADRVVSPYVFGARRIATEIYHPDVVDLLDRHAYGVERELEIESIRISTAAPFAGRCLRDSGIRERTGCTVVALRSAETGRFQINPTPETALPPGDTMIALGTPAQLENLQRLAG